MRDLLFSFTNMAAMTTNGSAGRESAEPVMDSNPVQIGIFVWSPLQLLAKVAQLTAMTFPTFISFYAVCQIF